MCWIDQALEAGDTVTIGSTEVVEPALPRGRAVELAGCRALLPDGLENFAKVVARSPSTVGLMAVKAAVGQHSGEQSTVSTGEVLVSCEMSGLRGDWQ